MSTPRANRRTTDTSPLSPISLTVRQTSFPQCWISLLSALRDRPLRYTRPNDDSTSPQSLRMCMPHPLVRVISTKPKSAKPGAATRECGRTAAGVRNTRSALFAGTGPCRHGDTFVRTLQETGFCASLSPTYPFSSYKSFSLFLTNNNHRIVSSYRFSI
ncbi:uncharacterized protein LOC143144201 [Ptiloglossa arizonensis]|uniref:uncharacterized protein LOC143144201 n=1 Tax=Ptiloglossa arizonensis TaxID=3350558 RepID=UPI003FA175B8